MSLITILGFWLIALGYLNKSWVKTLKNKTLIWIIKLLTGVQVVLGWIFVLTAPASSVKELFERVGLNSSSSTSVIAGFICMIITLVFYKIGIYIIKTIWQSSWQKFAKGVALLVLLVIPAASMLIGAVIVFAMHIEIGDKYPLWVWILDNLGKFFASYFLSVMMAGLLLSPIVVSNIIDRVMYSKESGCRAMNGSTLQQTQDEG